MILSVRDLEVTFRVGPVLRRQSIQGVAGVSFELDAGETFAIVGESGSGKTTLARAINGLQSISAGQVDFDGMRIDTLSRDAMKPLRQHMSMVFQDPVGSLSPRMRVGDLVAEPFLIHGLDVNLKEETERLLSLVGLSGDFSERYPHQLSGGQARRVGVARAIALNPKLIIADEPTAGLDERTAADVIGGLEKMKAGRTLVLATHDPNLMKIGGKKIALTGDHLQEALA